MIGRIRNARLGVFLNVGIGIVFIITAVIVVIAVNYNMRQQALIEAQTKARIILDRNLATHTYFSQIMKPSIFAWSEPFRSKEYFDHTWMSSTFAIREIEKYFKSLNPSGYSFKDAAIDARSPENEADEYERAFINKLNTDKNLESESTIRNIDGRPYLVVLRKGEVMEASCLKCHSHPRNAPKGLTDHYGSERSFNRKAGDAVSTVSLRIPLAEAYAEANIFSLKLSAILIIVLACLFTIQYWLYKRYLFQPLNVIRDKANEIATHEENLGEQISQPFGRELRNLTTSFNEMSVKLRHERDHLEELIVQRTEQLRKEKDFAESLIQTAQAIVLVLDTTGHIVSINAYMENMSGFSLKEVRGKDWFSTFLPERDRNSIRELFLNAINGIQTRGNVNSIVTKDGRELQIDWYDKILRDEKGNVVGLLSIGQDITERKKTEEALKKSDALHREAQAAAHIGHWELDTSIMTPTWSEEIFHIFGLDPEKSEPSFSLHEKITHPDDWDILNKAVTTSIAEGTPFNIEFRIVRPDNTIRWMHAIGHPRKDSQGRIERLFGTAQDITERKQAEEEKRRLEERSRKVVEDIFRFIPEGVLVFSLNMELLRQNQAFRDLVSGYTGRLGFAEDELENLIIDKVKAGLRDNNIKEIKIARKHEPSEQTFDEFEKLVLELDVARILFAEEEEEEEARIVVSIKDITYRKQAEDALRRSEENFRRSLDESPLGVRVVTVEGETIYANRAILDIYGYDSIEEFKTTSVEKRYTPESHAEFQIRREKRKRGEDVPSEYDISIVKKDGEVRHLQVFRKEILWDGKRQFQIIYNDITERKQAEEEVRTSSLQLRALAKRLEQIREEERIIISREIHDEMGGGLTGFKMDLSWLLHKISDADPGEERVAIMDKIYAANALIDQMIQVVRRISTDLRPSILDDLGLIAALEWQLSEFTKRTTIPHEFATTSEFVNMEEDTAVTVFRIFQEALTNVVRHARATKVTVVLREGERSLFGDETLVLEVSDNGRGITEEEIRNPESLGLLGMKERVLTFGGELSIRGKPGGGTTLVLKIPRMQGESS